MDISSIFVICILWCAINILCFAIFIDSIDDFLTNSGMDYEFGLVIGTLFGIFIIILLYHLIKNIIKITINLPKFLFITVPNFLYDNVKKSYQYSYNKFRSNTESNTETHTDMIDLVQEVLNDVERSRQRTELERRAIIDSSGSLGPGSLSARSYVNNTSWAHDISRLAVELDSNDETTKLNSKTEKVKEEPSPDSIRYKSETNDWI